MSNYKSISNNNINKRDSNIELLRIFAMLLIVLSHLSGHGIREQVELLASNNIIQQFNNYILIMFSFSGKIGVNIFLFIAGYFLINKKFKKENFIKFFTMTIFYSWLFLILSFIIGPPTHSPLLILRSIFPIGGYVYWFISTYLVFYLFINYVNKLLKILSKKEYIIFLLTCFLLWSLIPTLTIATKYGISGLSWFLFVYALGGYIRLYDIKLKVKNCLLYLIGIILIQSILVLIIISFKEIKTPEYIFNVNNLYQFFMGFLIFNIFRNINIKYNYMINYIASSAFAVYLIHENIFVSSFLWHRILHVENIYYSKFFIIYAILIAISVFLFCIFTDKLLSKIYKPIINIIVQSIEPFKNFIIKLFIKKWKLDKIITNL